MRRFLLPLVLVAVVLFAAGCRSSTPTPRFDGQQAILMVQQYLVANPCAPAVGFLWSSSYADGVWQVVRQKDSITLRWNVHTETGRIEPLQPTC